MKYVFTLSLLFFFTCLISCGLYAQGDPADTDVTNEYPTEYNSKKGNYIDYYASRSAIFTNMTPVEVPIQEVINGEAITFRSTLLSGTITLRDRVVRPRGMLSIFGDLEGSPFSSVQMTFNDGFLHAYIGKGSELYRIETLDGQNYIFKVDQSQVPLEGCSTDRIPVVNNEPRPHQNDHVSDDPNKRITYSCKIRVLVLYTTAYANATADPRGSIQGYMDYTNDANNLSQVQVDMELCYIEETAYNEDPDMYVDRNRFQADNDGFMDEVHDLRFKYEADYCHLMTNEPGHTGVAYSINSANSSEAFCLTNKGNAESIYTFAHEMGHLTGCRHDPYVDGTNVPYAWQHGYVYMNAGSNNFRTIMAYGTQCSDNGQSCNRVLRWSTPDITYNGVPAGTAGTHYNERVHDDEDDAKIAFNQADNSETLFDADVNQADYGYVTAQSYITTSGTVTIEGDDFDMVASDYIELNSGFTVQNGTYLFMDTQAVSTCP